MWARSRGRGSRRSYRGIAWKIFAWVFERGYHRDAVPVRTRCEIATHVTPIKNESFVAYL